jgi:hypothetical protein
VSRNNAPVGQRFGKPERLWRRRVVATANADDQGHDMDEPKRQQPEIPPPPVTEPQRSPPEIPDIHAPEKSSPTTGEE